MKKSILYPFLVVPGQNCVSDHTWLQPQLSLLKKGGDGDSTNRQPANPKIQDWTEMMKDRIRNMAHQNQVCPSKNVLQINHAEIIANYNKCIIIQFLIIL